MHVVGLRGAWRLSTAHALPAKLVALMAQPLHWPSPAFTHSTPFARVTTYAPVRAGAHKAGAAADAACVGRAAGPPRAREGESTTASSCQQVLGRVGRGCKAAATHMHPEVPPCRLVVGPNAGGGIGSVRALRTHHHHHPTFPHTSHSARASSSAAAKVRACCSTGASTPTPLASPLLPPASSPLHRLPGCLAAWPAGSQGVVSHVTDVRPMVSVVTYTDTELGHEVYQEVFITKIFLEK